MDYIEEIFNKHYSVSVTEIEDGVISELFRKMTLSDFRAAVKDIESDHLKRVCKTQ